jgi:hypothetical protein
MGFLAIVTEENPMGISCMPMLEQDGKKEDQLWGRWLDWFAYFTPWPFVGAQPSSPVGSTVYCGWKAVLSVRKKGML